MSLQMLPDMESSKGVAMLLRSSVCYCVEVFEVGIFARVCASPWKYVKAYRVSTEE